MVSAIGSHPKPVGARRAIAAARREPGSDWVSPPRGSGPVTFISGSIIHSKVWRGKKLGRTLRSLGGGISHRIDAPDLIYAISGTLEV